MILNILAFILPLAIFLYWSLIGYATISLLHSQRNIIQNLLIAPAIGYSVTLLPVFWLSRAGLPVEKFSLALAVILLAASLLLIWWRKPIFPVKKYLPFAAIFLLALFITGRPFLKFGFDWVSYVNEDMTNYCSGAFRFLKHGYFDIPNVKSFSEGKDYTLGYWLMHVPGMVRSGSELTLAFFSALYSLNPVNTFMPLILALHITLVSCTGALAMRGPKRKTVVALMACLLLTFSALTTLGTLYQLIAQVGGLCLLATSVVLLLKPYKHIAKKYLLLQSVVVAVVISALLITYPEVLPFLAISFVLYILIGLIRGWQLNKNFLIQLGLVGLITILFTNSYLIGAIKFLLEQVKLANSGTSYLFPYYLVPSGLADFWGLQALANYPTEPWMSFSIFLGLIISLAVIYALSLILRRFNTPATITTLVMFSLGIFLFIKGSDFALFKLAMYIQSFLIASVAIALYAFIKKTSTRIFLVLLFISSNLLALNFYVIRSEAITAGYYCEVPFASKTRINTEYANLLTKIKEDNIIVWNDYNFPLFKLLLAQSVNKRVQFDSYFPFLFNIKRVYISGKVRKTSLLPTNRYEKEVKQIFNEVNNMLLSRRFFLHDPANTQIEFYQTRYIGNENLSNPNKYILSSTAMRSIINNRHSIDKKVNFTLTPWEEVNNYLDFVNCSKGYAYYVGNQHSSLLNIEKDLYYPNRIMQGIGRYLLFRILHSSPQPRLSLAITNTLNCDGDNKLPPACIIGETRIKLPFIGRGSARIFSEPIISQNIGQIPYIILDMGKLEFKFPEMRTGLMKLYGSNRITNTKMIVAFARDISLISEDEYLRLNPPVAIKNFPNDLENKDLEYSGIYEDGWISEDSFFKLKQPANVNNLTIKGSLQKFDENGQPSQLIVLVDGKKVAANLIRPGNFSIKISVPSQKTSIKKVELYFNRYKQLSREDKRPAAALIKFIGFEN